MVTPAAERKPSPTAAILARSSTLSELSAQAQRLSGAVLGEYDLKSHREEMSPKKGMGQGNSVTALNSSDRRFKRARLAVPEAGLARGAHLAGFRCSHGRARARAQKGGARPRSASGARARRLDSAPMPLPASGHAGPMR